MWNCLETLRYISATLSVSEAAPAPSTYRFSTLKNDKRFARLELHAAKDAQNVFVPEGMHEFEFIVDHGSCSLIIASLKKHTAFSIAAMLESEAIVRARLFPDDDCLF